MLPRIKPARSVMALKAVKTFLQIQGYCGSFQTVMTIRRSRMGFGRARLYCLRKNVQKMDMFALP